MENYFCDFEENPDMLEVLDKLVKDFEKDHAYERPISIIATLMRKKCNSSDFYNDGDFSKFVPTITIRRKEPIPSTHGALLLEYDLLEIGKQITHIHFSYFAEIKSRELKNLVWTNKKQYEGSNFEKMMKWSYHLVHWIISEILMQKEDIKTRAKIMENIIHLALVRNILLIY